MKKLQRQMLLIGLCAVMALQKKKTPQAGWTGSGARASTSAGANTNVARSADAWATTAHEECSAGHSKCGRAARRCLQTICALLTAGFESKVSSDNWTAFRAQMRERLRQQQVPRWKRCGSFTGCMSCGIPGPRFQGICGLAWCLGPRLRFSRF